LRDDERGLQKGSICLCRSSVRGTWRGSPVLGIWKGMGRRVQRTGITVLRRRWKMIHPSRSKLFCTFYI